MSSCPFTNAFHCSFGLNRDAPGYTCTSRSTPAALASRAMICTISSRTSPRPPGNWCEARKTVGAATANPASAAAASAAPTANHLDFIMCASSKIDDRRSRRLLAHPRADLRDDPQLVLQRFDAGDRADDAVGVARLLAGRHHPAQAHFSAAGLDGEPQGLGGRVGVRRRPDVRLEREIGERAAGLARLPGLGGPGGLDGFLRGPLGAPGPRGGGTGR